MDSARPRLVFDCESDALLDTATTVICIGIASPDDDAVDVYGPDRIDIALARLSSADCLIGHNIAAFDLPLLLKLRGWAPAAGCTIRDTLVASRLILPQLKRLDSEIAARAKDHEFGRICVRYSLAAWGVRLGVPKLGADLTSFVWGPELEARCASDVRLTRALWAFLHVDGYSAPAMTLEHKAAAVCNRIVADGVPFDTVAGEHLAEQWEERRTEIAAALCRRFPGLRNPNSRDQIVALLEERGWIAEERTPTGKPRLTDEIIESIGETWPEFAGVSEYFALTRLRASLATGETPWLTSVDDRGRLHGALIHIGQPHSRAVHREPNLAGVPNPKKGARFGTECRTLFRAPPGWAMVSCDQANCQDRCLANYLANLDGGAAAREFAAGTDMHWRYAQALGLVPAGTERDKESALHTALRTGIKRFRYGFLFGGQAKRLGHIIYDIARAAKQCDPESGLQQQLFATTSRPSEEAITRAGAQALAKFENATPGLATLREKLERYASRHQWIPGLDGRRVPAGARHTVLNYLLVSAEAIICKRWLGNVFDELQARFASDATIVLWVHDEIVVCCRREIAEQVGEILTRWAIEAGAHYGLKCPLAAEYTIGRDWAGTPFDDDENRGLASPSPSGDAADEAEGDEGARNSSTISTGTAGAWATPRITQVPPGPEFEAILASLSAEDRGLVRPPKANGGGDEAADDGDGSENHEQRAAGNGHDQSNEKWSDYGGRKEDADKPYAPIRAALHARGYRVARTFAYALPNGTELFYEDRYELRAGIKPTKERPHKTSRYRHRLKGKELSDTGPRRIIYNWPAIMAAGPGANVLITEGANKSEPLNVKGLLGTAVPYHQWSPESVAALTGNHVFYLADHNPDGGNDPALKYADAARKKLAPVAASFRVVPAAHLWKHLPPGTRAIRQGDDVKDWLTLGGDPAKLLEICREIPAESATLRTVLASAITQRAITWLWRDRFALGKLGILAGLPDEGKSLILDDVAARITRGSLWPNGEGCAPLGNVILLTAEDDPEDTVIPRLIAAGADLDRIELVQMVDERNEKDGQTQERMFNLARDLPLLRRKIEATGNVKAILIDPITAYMGTSKTVDTFRDSDVRAVLTPFVHLAREFRIAIIVVMHFNKKIDITNALLRISNSLAFGGVARHVFSVTDDQENARKLMARAKNNLAARDDNKTLAFHFGVTETGADPETGEVIEAPFIVWEPGYVAVTSTEALAATAENKSPSAKEEAKQFLLDMLASRPVPSIEIEDAAKASCISLATLRRAKEDLGVIVQEVPGKARKDPEKWVWRLPEAM